VLTIEDTGCSFALPAVLGAGPPYSSAGGTNFQGSGSYSATLSLSPSAP
jgi:hypothetical protein